MSRTVLGACFVVLFLGLRSLHAQVERPAVAPELEQRFAALHQEFSSAVGAHQKLVEAAQSSPELAKQLPPRPQRTFAPRYIELADLGHPRAARWCLDFIGETSTDESVRRALFLRCEARLVPEVLWAEAQVGKGNPPPVDYGPRELLRSIGNANVLLGKEPALALCAQLFDRFALPESKALALQTQATIHLAGVARDAPPPPEVLALYRRLTGEFGQTDAGKRAAGTLFRMERLQLGMRAPDFATEDVEGVAFKLGDYRGKVVVLDFWGFW